MESKIILTFVQDLCKSSTFNNTINLIEKTKMEINWVHLLDMLKIHKIHILFYQYCKHVIPYEFVGLYSHMYHQSQVILNILRDEIVVLDNLLKKNNIPYILLKGFATSIKTYDTLMLRPTRDLDILLLNESDLLKAEQIVEDMGYLMYYKTCNYTYDTIPKGYRFKHIGYHEVQYMKKFPDGSSSCIELHLDCASIGSDIIEYFKYPSDTLQIDGIEYNVMNRIHMFLYLCANLHENFETNCGVYNNSYLRDIIDVVRYLNKFMNASDISTVYDLCIKYKIYHKVCLALNLSKYICPDIIPDGWITAFKCESSTDESYYDNGASVPWKMSLEERLFNKKNRCEEYSHLYISHCFSKFNPNFLNRIKANSEQVQETFNTCLNKKLSWKFRIADGNLILDILNVQHIFSDEDYWISIKLLGDSEYSLTHGGNPMQEFFVKYQAGKYETFDWSNKTYESTVSGDTLSIMIPCSDIYIHKGKFVGYNIFFCRPVIDDCIEWCGGVFEDYNPQGKLGVIEIL